MVAIILHSGRANAARAEIVRSGLSAESVGALADIEGGADAPVRSNDGHRHSLQRTDLRGQRLRPLQNLPGFDLAVMVPQKSITAR